MKAYEITFRIDKKEHVHFPSALIKVLPKDEDIRAIVLFEDAKEKKMRTEMQRIENQEYGYSYISSDAVYDDF